MSILLSNQKKKKKGIETIFEDKFKSAEGDDGDSLSDPRLPHSCL